MTCGAHEKNYETEGSRLLDIVAQHNLMQQKMADTLPHASDALVSLAAP